MHCLVVFGEYVVDLAVFDSINGIIFLVAFSECKFEMDREIDIRDRRTRTASAPIKTKIIATTHTDQYANQAVRGFLIEIN